MALDEELLNHQPPQSLEAEQAVLGSILIDSRCTAEVIGVVKPEDFYLRQNKEIFETIYSMFNYSQTIDPVTVIEKMKELGYHNDSTFDYIRQLMEITPTAANAARYANIVREKAMLRGLAQAAVDISETAIAQTKHNAALNGCTDRMSFQCADVFQLLTAMVNEKRKDYDFIILDPPAFTKSRDTLKNAIRGYREINSKAMKLLPRGGYLATCSCSHFMRDTYFRQMLHDASAEAGVTLRQIEGRQQSPDHPILWNVPETDYLKFYIFQIV